jgi:predicted dienelactone hydrolase
MRSRFIQSVAVILAAMASSKTALPQYNPLELPGGFTSQSIELTVEYAKPSRQVPLRIALPATKQAAPVVFFSHGLGGSRDGNHFMGNHWSGRGYVAVFLQHPGSDTSVWKNTPMRERMDAMRQAASAKNLLLRCEDVHATIDQLERWNRTEGHALFGRLDLQRIGMSGHSFGAHTTQAVSGQKFPIGKGQVDDRIAAAIAFSPSSPAAGSKAEAFGSVKIPWMLMTGTKDTAPIGGQSVESRLEVYPNLPKSIDKYELLLKDAEHSVFTDRRLPGEKMDRNPNHHRAILALSTAFWDGYLKQNAAAVAWLKSVEVERLLERDDRWQLNLTQ